MLPFVMVITPVAHEFRFSPGKHVLRDVIYSTWEFTAPSHSAKAVCVTPLLPSPDTRPACWTLAI